MKQQLTFDEFVNSRDESLINEVIMGLIPDAVIDWRDHYTVDVYSGGEQP